MIHEESINSIENRCDRIYCGCLDDRQRGRVARMRRVIITAIAYEFYALGFIDSPFLMHIRSGKNGFIRKEKCTLSREEILENSKKYEVWFKAEYCS